MSPRINEYTVIFDEEVLFWIAHKFRHKYPLENGMFLFGEYWPSRYNIPYITEASEAANAEHFTDEWKFDHSEVLRRTRIAAKDGRMLLGWTHSHPWDEPIIGINMQTITDARTQIEYRFTISLIVGIWESGWWCNAWKEGFAAPLEILIRTTKGDLITIKKWYYKKWQTKPWYY